jgi:hypothetical protein
MSIEAPSRHREREWSDGRAVATEACPRCWWCTKTGSWSFHGLDAPGVKVSKSDATALAQGIVKAAE